jgi:hypothetical protein
MADSQQLGPEFVHSPLDSTLAEIRLVQVQSGPASSVIKCKLRHSILLTDYVCLSYVCGSDEPANTIMLNGQPYRIRNNLHSFLKTTRADGNLDWFWIDAICIDQINIPERNRQVQQMGSIYSKARRVNIWLGDGTALSQQALVVVGTLGAAGWWRDREKWYCFQNKISPKVSEFFWKALSIVHWNQYWGRLWVIQEMLQSKDAVVCLGSARCALVDYVWFALGMLEDRIIDYIPDLSKHFADEEKGNLTLHNVRMLKAVSRKWKTLSEQQLLAELFDLFGHLHCSDGHDKIFALVSCAKNGSQFEVNYEDSLVALHHKTLTFCQESEMESNDRLVEKLWTQLGLEADKEVRALDLSKASIRTAQETKDIVSQP